MYNYSRNDTISCASNGTVTACCDCTITKTAELSVTEWAIILPMFYTYCPTATAWATIPSHVLHLQLLHGPQYLPMFYTYC